MTPLVEIQKWFGAMISQPLQPDNAIAPITPFGTEVKVEAAKHIAPSPALESYQRIQIYHQQYWWRLLKCLQENFPSLTNLYGHESFNQKIGIPYLSENPPTHWALCRLGQSLPIWLEKHNFPTELAHIDAAAQRAFWMAAYSPIDFAALSEQETLTKKLFLQPHVHLFSFEEDFFSFREALLNKENAELKKGKCFFALYRNPKNQVKWKELMIGEYNFLALFKEGMAIQEACLEIEKKGGKSLQEAEELLPLWFREWTFLQWFCEV